MRTRRSTAARLSVLLGIPAALVVSGLLVSGASYSAFSATATAPSSNWSSGTVALADDGTGSALFNVTGLKPGLTGSNCITVTSTGSLPSTVKLYVSASSATNVLASALTLTVQQGTGGSFGSCGTFSPDATNQIFSGPLSTLATQATAFSNGLGTWTTAGSGSESKTYRVSYSLPIGAPSTAAGLSCSATLTWEAQNT